MGIKVRFSSTLPRTTAQTIGTIGMVWMSDTNQAGLEKAALSDALRHRQIGQREVAGWRRTLKSAWNQRSLYILAAPLVIGLFLFAYLPIYGILMAFKDLDYMGMNVLGSPWAKPVWKYFDFIRDPFYWGLFANTVKIATAKFMFGFPAPIILALLLNELRLMWFKRFVQTVSYLPHFVSWVVLSGIMMQIFSTEGGALVEFQKLLGIQPGPDSIMAKNSTFLPLVVLSSIYKEVGWGTILFLAAIAGIDPQLYEAAVMDGGGKWAQMRHITIPGMMPTVTIVLVLSIPGITAAGFDQIYNLMNPMVMRSADIVETFVLRVGLFERQYSFASAVGLFNSIIAFTLILVSNYISKRTGGSGIW